MRGMARKVMVTSDLIRGPVAFAICVEKDTGFRPFAGMTSKLIESVPPHIQCVVEMLSLR